MPHVYDDDQSTSRQSVEAPARMPRLSGPLAAEQQRIAGDLTAKERNPSSADPMRIAKEGMTGPGQELPHRAQLERSFGRDLSQIKAYQGPATRQASEHLGASAYAMDGAVAFGQSPDLHTAAEETAHALQHYKHVGGSGERMTKPGGAVESEASRAADAVVANQSVGGLQEGLGSGVVARRSQQQGAAVSPAEQRLAASSEISNQELATVKGTMQKKSFELNDKQLMAHIIAQYVLWQEMVGKKAPDEKIELAKFVDEAGVMDMLGNKYPAHTVSGSIGYQETTEGLNADETVRTLGLDYEGSGFVQRRDDKQSSAIHDERGKQSPVPTVFVVKFELPKQTVENNMGVSFSDDMIKSLQSLKAKYPDFADRLKNDFPTVNYKDLLTPDTLAQTMRTRNADPYKGTGMTGTGNKMEGRDTINQELAGKTRTA
ncbi:MAG: DUF4157 domain-containing protein, partial [Myxococcales bacterium]|nr:DUF4157 domain-containing protein [Myxococcales bacterium]